jgi:hypothetical protein
MDRKALASPPPNTPSTAARPRPIPPPLKFPARGLIPSPTAPPTPAATPRPTPTAVTAPADGATYTLGQTVPADYVCSDAGSGIAASGGCSGPVADGASIDTASLGAKTFTVTATDQAGNTAQTPVGYTVVKGTDGAEYISDTLPSTMLPGKRYIVEVTMKNAGTSYWLPGVHRLGNPKGYEAIRAGAVVTGSPVAPGQNHAFRFYLVAPSTPGAYTPRWQMKHPAGGWFGPLTPERSITVAGNGASFASQSAPTSMAAGAKYRVSVTMTNSGGTTWTAGAGYQLAVVNPLNTARWQTKRVSLPAGVSIAPGESHTFEFWAKAPAVDGTYDFQWRMLQNGVEYFGSPSDNVAVEVRTNAAAVTGHTMPPVAPAGTTVPVEVTVENTGTTTWTAGGGYYLGARNPLNTTTWGVTWVPLPSGVSVPPGKTYTFTFSVTVPSSVGTYDFQWGMLQSRVEYFGSSSANHPVLVP